MKFNYIGIDADPPKRTPLVALLSNGTQVIGNSNTPGLIAWALPERCLTTERLQVILRGLPELRMVRCITSNPVLAEELINATRFYTDRELAAFTNFIRTLDIRAHNGAPCIPHFHN